MTNSIDTAAALAAAKSKLAITAAYKFVAMAVMLTNCNLIVQQTQLPINQPIALTNISKGFAAPPNLAGFGGSIVYSNYFFGFGHSHFANFANVDFRRQTREKQIEWSKMTSQIGTNDVHTLALTWLNNLGVDTVTLEQKYPCKIIQRFYYNKTGGELKPIDSIKVPLPIYVISWGSIPLKSHPQYSYPAATMTIFGPTKELIEYHLFDDALMLRPKLEIKDFEKLLAIPNADFKQYTKSQCDDLVKQYGN